MAQWPRTPGAGNVCVVHDPKVVCSNPGQIKLSVSNASI